MNYSVTQESTGYRWLPYFIGMLVVAILASLGMWQISRGLDKRASLDAYSSAGGYTAYYDGLDVQPFQQLRLNGRYRGESQLLLDNMVENGRPGHYVITPFDTAEGVLLVNRGWIPTASERELAGTVALNAEPLTVHGRVGRLPRAGMRMGEPFAGSSGWPRHAVYPRLDEVAELLDDDLLPFVLLLDAGDEFGFVRQWQPEEMSASRHFGYAFQWFAMAVVLAALLYFRRWKRKRA